MEQFQDGQTADIPADQIDADFNYRRRYKQADMEELRDGIRATKGRLIHRVILRLRDTGRLQLIVGNKRYRALVEEYGPQVPVPSEIRVLTDEEATTMMARENSNRSDPSVIEDAELASRMLGVCKGDRAEAAARLGWKPALLDRRLALMNATQLVRDAYLEDHIGVGHVELLAALRKEVQDRVITVCREKSNWPTVDQLKAMAEQSLQNLESAIFDRAECNGCQFNTGFQQAMFDTNFEGSRCTNKECFTKKTESTLESRKAKLEETYQVVRIVRPGDNSTVIALRAEGKRPVGAEQATACRTCANFGACVSGVPDSLGKVYEEVCFDQACNDQKVAAYRKQLKDAEDAATQQQAGSSQRGDGAAGGDQPNGVRTSGASDANPSNDADEAAGKPARAGAAAASIRPAIKEYREQIWRAVLHRAALKLPMLQNRMLLLALIAHRPSYLDNHKAVDAINKALGTDIPTVGAKTKKLMQIVMTLDQAKVGSAFQHLAAYLTNDMPIEDVTGFLQALEVKLADHWKVNETFFDTLTKIELDAVCVEIGLAEAAGKTYASLKNGSKKDFVKAMLKVEGFNYLGAIPKMMRWDSRA